MQIRRRKYVAMALGALLVQAGLATDAAAQGAAARLAALEQAVAALGDELDGALERIDALEAAQGEAPAFAFASQNDFVSTSSADWQTVPGMSVAVETEGRQLLRFCAEIATSGTGSGRLQALVDGVPLVTGPALPPGASLQFSLSGPFAPACFQWVTPALAPGLHAFDVQWRTFGDSTTVNHRVLTVEQR